jgi:NAD(P)-dependent dehydrogenase (short-subunit alcohol dehydrogenase family)
MTKTVVITGAARGLGLSLARAYRAQGDVVIGGCRRPETADLLRSLGAEAVQLDTADAASIASFAQAVGQRPVDILINCAGIDARDSGATEAARSALDLTGEQFDRVMRVNVTGPLLVVQALAAGLRAAKGKLINISSQIGSMEVAQTMGRDVAYAASKAALNMVTIKQSQVLSPSGVTVIAMHPGWLKTAMGGAAAALDPDETAPLIVATIESLTIADTARFLRWDGTTHPW